MAEKKPFDLNSVHYTQEEDYGFMNQFFRKYYPGPGEFDCGNCEQRYYDRLKRRDDEWRKAHGCPVVKQTRPTPSTENLEVPSQQSATAQHIAETISTVTALALANMDMDVATTRTFPGRTRHKSEFKRGGPTTPKDDFRSPAQSINATAPKPTQPKPAANDDETSSEPPIAETKAEMSERPIIPKSQQVWVPYNEFYFGCRSGFTVVEQQRYVAMLCNLQDQGQLRTKFGNDQKYKAMTAKMQVEVQKFNEFVKKAKENDLVTANEFLPKVSQNYILSCFKKKAQAITKALPHLFCIKGIQYIQLAMHEPPRLEFSKLLLRIGKPPRIILPDLTRKVTGPIEDIPEIEKVFPIGDRADEGLLNKDPNLVTLVQKYGPQFVACTNALRCLMVGAGPLLADECLLPVMVEPTYVQGRRQTVVYISKPLPPLALPKRRKFAYIAKYALKSRLVGTAAGASASCGVDDSFLYEDDLANYSLTRDENSASDDDVVNASCDPLASSQGGTDTPDSEGASQSSYNFRRRGGALTDVEDVETETVGKGVKRKRRQSVSQRLERRKNAAQGKAEGQESGGRTADSGDVLGGIMSKMVSIGSGQKDTNLLRHLQAKSFAQRGSTPAENSREYVLPTKLGCMRQYSLWDLKNYQLLLRSNVDGVRNRPNVAGRATDECMQATISAKVEYLPSFGAEQRTEEEELYESLTALLKTSEIHYRGHIKYDREYDILAITSERKLVQSSAVEKRMLDSMRRLYSILGELKKLDEGVYILRMRKSDPYQVTIFCPVDDEHVSLDESCSIDIGKMYKSTSPAWLQSSEPPAFSSCWRQIDPRVVFQWHRVAKRVPASFPPRKEDEEPNFEPKKSSVKTKPQTKKRPQQKRRKGKRGRPAKAKKEPEGEGEDDFIDTTGEDICGTPGDFI